MERSSLKGVAGVLVLILLAAGAWAQQAENNKEGAPGTPLAAYKVDFVLRELSDNNVINTRNYSMLLENGNGRERVRGEIRTGARIPVSSPDNKSFEYLDLGVHIDCFLRERESGVLLFANLDMSSAADQNQQSGAQPVIRQVRANMDSLVPLGKPTIITSIDDAGSKRRYLLEVTVTKVK